VQNQRILVAACGRRFTFCCHACQTESNWVDDVVLCTASWKCVCVFFVVFQACELPLFEYIADKMSALCYERAWYTKLGGYEMNSVAAAAAADISSAKPEMMFC